MKNLKKTYLGDIIISFNYINKPKITNLKIFKKKSIKIFIHGFLHLLGFDHIKKKDYKKMLKEEQKFLNQLKKLLIKLKKKKFIFDFIIIYFWELTSLSLPPFNFFYNKFFYI